VTNPVSFSSFYFMYDIPLLYSAKLAKGWEVKEYIEEYVKNNFKILNSGNGL
jgi:hypothetical protein